MRPCLSLILSVFTTVICFILFCIMNSHPEYLYRFYRREQLQKKETLEDCHTLLGVEKGASRQKIQSSFRKLALKFHPDRNDGDTTEKMAELSACYENLTKAVERSKMSNDQFQKYYEKNIRKRRNMEKKFRQYYEENFRAGRNKAGSMGEKSQSFWASRIMMPIALSLLFIRNVVYTIKNI